MSFNNSNDFLVVAAIDFGTTFSGYAFSFRDSPEKITMNKNWGTGFSSYKTATSVLTNGAGEFLDFGFEAEKRYVQELEEGSLAPNMHLFRHFKMMLMKSEKLNKDPKLSSVDGTIMPAIDVFSHALRYLKDHLMKLLEEKMQSKPRNDDIRWVITVPAIWGDEAKHFMRRVAYQAGCIDSMNSRDLVIALEPEAASLCCRRMHLTQYETEHHGFPPETRYLVLDCGGGTVDITLHEVMYGEKVREILRASGGPWGGTEVDKNFDKLMCLVLGANFVKRIKQHHPYVWLQFLTEFEKKKNAVTSKNGRISIDLPFTFDEIFREENGGMQISSHVQNCGDQGVQFNNGMIVLTQKAIENLFFPVIESITSYTEVLLDDEYADNIQYILMVGGFSESKMLQEKMKARFEDTDLKVLIPSDAQLAIIKGAVLYGHMPDEIQSRLSRYTYGFEISEPFDHDVHDIGRMITVDGEERCDDVLRCVVEQDEEVEAGSKITHTVLPYSIHETETTIKIHIKDGKPCEPVQYTDEDGIRELGEVTVQVPLDDDEENRDIDVEFTFGGTEIQVEATVQATGESAETHVAFYQV